MHADELHIDDAVVRRLLGEQFPQWANLPLRRVPSFGTVNAIFRLGDELAVRAPFVPNEQGIEQEGEWMPRLAPHLPVRTPRVLGVGHPTPYYPSTWLVVDWIPGATPAVGSFTGSEQLADFIRALQRLDTAGAPPAYRSGDLVRHDTGLREALTRIHEVDAPTLTRLWERALAAPPWPHPPVWVHGDLLPSNVIVTSNGGLVGIIDMAPGVADPAAELITAWNLVPGASRTAFREALDIDDATWSRGIGWAILQASMSLPYYRDINPGMAEMALYALREIVSD